jgi:hypothetical protein
VFEKQRKPILISLCWLLFSLWWALLFLRWALLSLRWILFSLGGDRYSEGRAAIHARRRGPAISGSSRRFTRDNDLSRARHAPRDSAGDMSLDGPMKL